MTKQIQYNLSKRILMIILIFVCAVFGVFLCVLGFSPYESIELTQSLNNSIDYSVQLKENNYFTNNNLPSGGKYISNLIQYFDIDFNYSSDFSYPVSGSYVYRIVATISANEGRNMGGADYWSRDFELFKSSEKDIEEARDLTFSQNIKVGYDEYNNLLRDFKRSYDLSAAGKLQVALIVEGELINNLFDAKILLRSEISMSVPLTEQAVEVSVDTNARNNIQPLATLPRMSDGAIAACRVAGLFLIVVTVITAVASYYVGRITEASTEYRLHVKKLLSSYAGIIVDLKSSPNLAGIKVSEVGDFDELLDVYNSIHMPINYYESRNISTFIIIHEKMAWKFVIRLSDYK